MADTQIFEKLFNGGNFALPYLIRFSHETAGEVCLVNNNEGILFNNKYFNASTFDYTPPNAEGSGATLSISGLATENDLFEFLENADHNIKLEVVGVIVDNTIEPLHIYKHFHGMANITENANIDFTLQGDDRLEMTFPPYTYDTDNNRGNA